MITGWLLAVPIGVGTGILFGMCRMPAWLTIVTAACLGIAASLITQSVGLP